MRIELPPLTPGATLEEFKRIYYAEIAGRTRRGMRAKLERGGWPHRAPLGYRNLSVENEKAVVLDPTVAPYIREAFRMARRSSVRKVLAHVTEKGFRRHDGRKLSPSTLHSVLTNPFYAGRVRFDGRTHSGKHQPLVTQKLFQEVQERLNTSRKRSLPPK